MKNNKAFTLAETLVTLLIIGLMAVVTLPTLLSEINKRTRDGQKQAFSAKLQEGLRQMQVNDALTNYYETTDDFLAAMQQYFKSAKVCSSNELSSCFSSIIKLNQNTVKYNLKTDDISKATDIRASEYSYENVTLGGIAFTDGTNALVAYKTGCSVPNKYDSQADLKQCFAMMYDVNGKEGPNIIGDDIDTINIDYNGKGLEIGELYTTSSVTIEECNAYKNDGIQVLCPTERVDYYAYAAWKCQSQGKRLPSRSELKKVAAQLYGIENVNASGGGFYSRSATATNGIADSDLWNKLGGNSVTLLSNSEEDNDSVYVRYFSENSTVETTTGNGRESSNNAGHYNYAVLANKYCLSGSKFYCVD